MIELDRRCPARLIRQPVLVSIVAGGMLGPATAQVSAPDYQAIVAAPDRPEDLRDAAVFRPQVPVNESVLKYQKPL